MLLAFREVRREAARMLRLLEHMSTDDFASGADRPVRDFLTELAGPWVIRTPEEVKRKWL